MVPIQMTNQEILARFLFFLSTFFCPPYSLLYLHSHFINIYINQNIKIQEEMEERS